MSSLSLILQADYSRDFTDATLNLEELIHVPELKFGVVVCEFAVVAKTFQEDELLGGALLANGRLNQFDYEFHVVVDGGILVLLEVVVVGHGLRSEFPCFTGGHECFTDRCIASDMCFDQLVN
jgi:hypothetical protein